MSRVFAVLREETEAASELRNVNGMESLPTGTLANAAENVKNSITGFVDARKSDIENERLPDFLVDANEVEGFEKFADAYGSPSASASSGRATPTSPAANGHKSPWTGKDDTPITSIPSTPDRSPDVSPGVSPGRKFGHGRTSSLGTTSTSPSNRRRSLENSLMMLRAAMESKDAQLEELAETISGTKLDDDASAQPAAAAAQ
ncbi:hypothetical protein BT69DRAFT_1353658 [Atractiella rhizophila]|nr:hypothetical protein BT69DRAFT_1353658 [Atractiella rhizophila]